MYLEQLQNHSINLVILKTKFNLDMHSCEINEDFIYEWKRLDLLNELLLV